MLCSWQSRYFYDHGFRGRDSIGRKRDSSKVLERVLSIPALRFVPINSPPRPDVNSPTKCARMKNTVSLKRIELP